VIIFMINNQNPIWEKFDLKNNLIKEYKYWNLLIRKNQVKLGSCVAILKRDAYPMSEITEEEMAEYALLTKEVENALQESFKPHTIHHLALMFMDKQIHFHIFPRYTKKINFAGIEWEDDNVPDPLVQKRENVDQNLLNEIRDQIKSKML